jgi:hypothetical protein
MLREEIYDRCGNCYQANTQMAAISPNKELTGIQPSSEVIFDFEDGKAVVLRSR